MITPKNKVTSSDACGDRDSADNHHIDRGNDAYMRGDYKAALTEWMPLA